MSWFVVVTFAELGLMGGVTWLSMDKKEIGIVTGKMPRLPVFKSLAI